MRLTQRLLWGSLAVITAFVFAAVAIVDRRVDRRSFEETRSQLAREARLVSADVAASTNYAALVSRAAAALGRRVTLLDSSGVVIADSEIPVTALARVDNQRGQPDIQAALDSGRMGSAEYSYAGQNLLHVTVPTPGGAVRVSVPADAPRSLSVGVRRDLLLSGALASLVALVLAYVFAQSVSRPVTELRDVARSLAAGDLSRRPTISASGELGELATAVHQLSYELSARMAALSAEERLVAALVDSLQEGVVAINSRRSVVRINAAGRALLGVSQPTPFSSDLLPRHRQLREAIADSLAGRTVDDTEMEMESSRVILTARPLTGGGAVVALLDITAVRRLETIRRDFVANVSHELRTPLTIIGGFAETLASGDVPAEKAALFAEAIRANAVRMQRLVDDLLDLSRIESGGWAPKPAMLDVQEVSDEAISLVDERAREKGLSVQRKVMAGAEKVYCDPTALRQVLSNLLENALRHTSEGGITVVAAPYEKGVRISVHDTGAGIAAEHIPRIFERFYRADPGRAREQGGTGLGLSIVRHLVEAHGGSVSAESVMRRGTTVTVDFPATRV